MTGFYMKCNTGLKIGLVAMLLFIGENCKEHSHNFSNVNITHSFMTLVMCVYGPPGIETNLKLFFDTPYKVSQKQL